MDATIKKSLLVELNMSTPWDTDTYYELGVTTTVVAGQPQLKLCNVILKYEGLNVPCIYPRDQLYITTTGGGPYDKFVWDLGRIRNAAQRWSTFCVIAVRGGAPIGAGGVMTPHFSRQRGRGTKLTFKTQR